jgi:hypothetical protein
MFDSKGRGDVFRTIATIAFLALAATASADPLTLASHYRAVGTNADGSKYNGVAAVNILSDSTFSIVWTIGGAIYQGFGMRRNDALAATYMINGSPGLVIYKVEGDGVLHGLWAVRGQMGDGTETLTPAD